MADKACTPDFLAAQGITRVRDNLAEGQRVRAPDGLIFTFFGDALLLHLTEKHHANRYRRKT